MDKEKLKDTILELEEIILELNEGMTIQDASSNLMSFLIQDLLDFAQIKAGKFRKNIQ